MLYFFSPYIFVELSSVRVRKSLLSWLAINTAIHAVQLRVIEL